MQEYASVIIVIRVPVMSAGQVKRRIETVIHYANLVAYVTPDQGAMVIKDNSGLVGKTTLSDVLSRLRNIIFGPKGEFNV
jgi:hypothetical protein